MLRHIKYAGRIVAFLVLMILCLSVVNRILLPKYYFNGDWPATSTYLDFYNMEEDTVDVLFLGSSHCAAAFSPVELYEKYGIKSYNLGCEQQNILLSYYWLQEAMRFQKPQYVFLDTFMLFPYDSSAALNTSEATTRKAVDFMKWSGVKFRAVKDICRIDENQKISSYIFPNERFHTRWKWLSEDDFTVASVGKHETLMGFFPIDFTCNIDSFQPFEETFDTEYAEMVPVMREYLDKLVELCKENGIELVLVKTPTMFYSREAHNTVSAYAYENGLEYIDFNEEGIYHDAGLIFAQDSCDTDHVSVSGAMKVSDYVGEWLFDKVPNGQKDEQWEKRARYYSHYLKDEGLKTETDIYRYLEQLQDENYSILVAVMGDASELFLSDVAEGLRSLGLKPESAEEYGTGYYAVIDGGKVVAEECGRALLKGQGTIRDGLVSYRVTSAGTDSGSTCSILLDSGETALRQTGLNITVYCNDRKGIIDRVCLYIEDGKASIKR